MKEIIQKSPKQLFTNLLTPSKPYLCFNKTTKEFIVLYWISWFYNSEKNKRYRKYRNGLIWSGSGWYDSIPKNQQTKSTAKERPNAMDSNFQIWELPGISYKKSKDYTKITA